MISERNFKLHAMLSRKESLQLIGYSDADLGGDVD
jgi:hypothetical protein